MSRFSFSAIRVIAVFHNGIPASTEAPAPTNNTSCRSCFAFLSSRFVSLYFSFVTFIICIIVTPCTTHIRSEYSLLNPSMWSGTRICIAYSMGSAPARRCQARFSRLRDITAPFLCRYEADSSGSEDSLFASFRPDLTESLREAVLHFVEFLTYLAFEDVSRFRWILRIKYDIRPSVALLAVGPRGVIRHFQQHGQKEAVIKTLLTVESADGVPEEAGQNLAYLRRVLLADSPVQLRPFSRAAPPAAFIMCLICYQFTIKAELSPWPYVEPSPVSPVLFWTEEPSPVSPPVSPRSQTNESVL